MSRINTVLVFFLLLFVALSAAGWAFIQSKAFGRLLSKAITEVSSQKFDTKIKFSRIGMKFFPPGIALENINLEYNKEGTKIFAEAGELGVFFDLDTFRNSKFRLKEIFLREGFAKLEIAKDESSGKHPWDVIQNELEKLPIDIGSLAISDSRVIVEGVSLDVNNLVIFPGSKVIRIDGDLKQIGHEKIPSSIDLLRIIGDLKKDYIFAKSFQILQKRSQIKGNLTIKDWSDVTKTLVEGDIDSEVFLPDIKEWLEIEPVKVFDGIVKTKGKLTWSEKSGPRLSSDFEITNLESNIVRSELILGKIISNEIGISIPTLSLKNHNEKIDLISPVLVWDQKNRKILPDPVLAKVQKLELNNALTFLGEPLQPLKGAITGNIKFQLKGKNLYFTPDSGFKVEGLRLEIKKSDTQIMNVVKAPELWLYKSEFNVINGEFQMSANIKAPKSQFDISGSVNKNGVNFKIPLNNISLQDFGNIAELDLKGEGENKISVSGPLDDVSFSIEGDFRNFEILGYKLGDTNHRIDISLKDGSVELPFFKAKKSRYAYSGSGIVNFKKFLLDLSIDIPNISYSEFKDAISPISSGLSFLPSDFEANIQGGVEIFAKDSIKNLKVGADVYAQKITAYGEAFKDSKFTFIYADKVIQLKNFSVIKEEGKVFSDIAYNLNASRLDYQLSLRNMSSTEISFYKKLPLSVEFNGVGEFKGSYSSSRWSHKGYLALTKSRIYDKYIPDSIFEWDVSNESINLDAKIVNGWISLFASSYTNKNKQTVSATLEVDIDDLPLFMRGLLGENPQLLNSTGQVKLSSTLSVTDWQWDKLNSKLWLKNLQLITPEIGIKQNFPTPQIIVRDGTIQSWDFKVINNDFRLNSKATGGIDQGIVVKTDLDAEAKYLELLSKHIQRAEGRFLVSLRNILKSNKFDIGLESTAKDITLTTDLLPFSMGNLNYSISVNEGELEIENFSFRPDSGKVQANGSIAFNRINPDVNIRYTLERASIPIKNKSHITASGSGMLFGGKPPYLLNGDITINKGSILNELNDFTGKGSQSADTKYLPSEQDGAFSNLVNLDLSVRTENPINLNNSLMDVYLVGDLQLSGDVLNPAAEGKVQTSQGASKVFFKNSEYQINKAELLFSSRKKITNPDFEVAASSVIANYKVTAKAFGNPESFTFDLSSDPALSKQNILSLIAFGYTDDLSNSISAGERQNLTNVGVGSFIFDQFKVTDIVKKQFGLQVNLGTVFVQSSDSMLAGRSQDQTGGANALARTRTATNIEVKKRISEAMSLSVSSTVGGSIGQRQRMNLNYGLSRKVQLEGIYELRTNAEGTEDIIDNSIGGDVKFRMTFK
ncbi:MAG: translocation/assembly module TamB [Bacteriovoracaceae bacterium]|nr:translocation/assembly module TamB [Bacteriovoracaceae bacterium]